APAVIYAILSPVREKATVERASASGAPPHSAKTAPCVLCVQPGGSWAARLVRHHRFVSATGAEQSSRGTGNGNWWPGRTRRTAYHPVPLARRCSQPHDSRPRSSRSAAFSSCGTPPGRDENHLPAQYNHWFAFAGARTSG